MRLRWCGECECFSVSWGAWVTKAILVSVFFTALFCFVFGIFLPASSTTNNFYSELLINHIILMLCKPQEKVEYIVFVGLICIWYVWSVCHFPNPPVLLHWFQCVCFLRLSNSCLLLFPSWWISTDWTCNCCLLILSYCTINFKNLIYYTHERPQHGTQSADIRSGLRHSTRKRNSEIISVQQLYSFPQP